MENHSACMGVISMAYRMMTADELLKLKAAIKAEMLRRNAPIGGLDAYGSSSYDFSSTPVSGGVVKADIGKKTVDLLLKIQDHGDLVNTEQGAAIPQSFTADLITYVNELAAEPMDGARSS